MGELEKLYKDKTNLLQQVLDITNDAKFIGENGYDIGIYTKVYEDRVPVFQKLQLIDDRLNELNQPLSNDDIKKLSLEIIKIDNAQIDKRDEMIEFLKKNMVEISNSKKVANHYSVDLTDGGSGVGFDSKG